MKINNPVVIKISKKVKNTSAHDTSVALIRFKVNKQLKVLDRTEAHHTIKIGTD